MNTLLFKSKFKVKIVFYKLILFTKEEFNQIIKIDSKDIYNVVLKTGVMMLKIQRCHHRNK